MRMFSERIACETPELATRACGCASSAAASASRRRCSSRWTGPRSETAANDRITLFVAFNYGGRAEILDAAERYSGGGEEAFRAPALRARDARPRPHHPHERRAAPVATTCSGSRPTPSSSSATSCGPTSRARRSSARWTSTRAGGAGSGGADGGDRAARAPAAPQRRRGRARRRDAARTSARGSLVAIPAIAFALFIVGQGGLVFALGLLAARHRLPARALRDVRRAHPARLAGFLGARRRCSSPRTTAASARSCSARASPRPADLRARACCSRAAAARRRSR